MMIVAIAWASTLLGVGFVIGYVAGYTVRHRRAE